MTNTHPVVRMSNPVQLQCSCLNRVWSKIKGLQKEKVNQLCRECVSLCLLHHHFLWKTQGLRLIQNQTSHLHCSYQQDKVTAHGGAGRSKRHEPPKLHVTQRWYFSYFKRSSIQTGEMTTPRQISGCTATSHKGCKSLQHRWEIETLRDRQNTSR